MNLGTLYLLAFFIFLTSINPSSAAGKNGRNVSSTNSAKINKDAATTRKVLPKIQEEISDKIEHVLAEKLSTSKATPNIDIPVAEEKKEDSENNRKLFITPNKIKLGIVQAQPGLMQLSERLKENVKEVSKDEQQITYAGTEFSGFEEYNNFLENPYSAQTAQSKSDSNSATNVVANTDKPNHGILKSLRRLLSTQSDVKVQNNDNNGVEQASVNTQIGQESLNTNLQNIVKVNGKTGLENDLHEQEVRTQPAQNSQNIYEQDANKKFLNSLFPKNGENNAVEVGNGVQQEGGDNAVVFGSNQKFVNVGQNVRPDGKRIGQNGRKLSTLPENDRADSPINSDPNFVEASNAQGNKVAGFSKLFQDRIDKETEEAKSVKTPTRQILNFLKEQKVNAVESAKIKNLINKDAEEPNKFGNNQRQQMEKMDRGWTSAQKGNQIRAEASTANTNSLPKNVSPTLTGSSTLHQPVKKSRWILKNNRWVQSTDEEKSGTSTPQKLETSTPQKSGISTPLLQKPVEKKTWIRQGNQWVKSLDEARKEPERAPYRSNRLY